MRTLVNWLRMGVLSAIPAVLGWPMALSAQHADNSIFHYSVVELDAARASEFTVGTWDGSGWIGTDFDRLWWETEGEFYEDGIEEAEFTLLYGHYFRRFWDFTVGYRQDLSPARQGYLSVGIMGLAPYWFEVGVFAQLSHRGRPSLRVDVETDLFITQRLVLTPEWEMDWLITSDNVLDESAGISDAEGALRLRYEIRRKFAPFVDLRWVQGHRTREATTEEDDLDGLRFGFGLRLAY